MVRKHDTSCPQSVSRAERRRRLFGSRRLDLERLESRQLLALLSSGAGEGHLQVQVNEFGAFGRSGDLGVASPLQNNGVREIGDAFYDPIGPLPSAGTTFESGLAVKVNGDPVQFLTAGTIANSGNFANGLFNVPVDPTNRVLQSTFYYPSTAGPQGQGATLRFDLRQELILKIVSGTAPVGVTMRQTYTVTNLTGTAVDLEIFRYYDGDLLYDSTFLNDGAGMRQVFANEPERVWMTNTATNTNRNNPAYVEVRSNVLPDSSGVPTNRFNRWEVGLAQGAIAVAPNPPYSAANPGKNRPSFLTNAPLVQKILNDGPLANDIIGPTQADIDGNNKVDNTAANDWAVALRNVYTLTGANASIVYIADTQFGDPEIGDPEPVIPPPAQRGTVSGTKFSDTDSDGVFDIGEVGVGGFRIYADVNNNSRFDTGEPSAITNANGQYSFLLNVGTWNIREVQQPNWTQTLPGPGFYTVTLVNSGDVVSNINFGNHAVPGSVSGVVFEDFNKNGRFELGEPGLGSVVVYADINNNGVFEVGEPNTTSAVGTGAYTLANLDPRVYVIRQVVPAGYDQTFPSNNQGQIIALSPAQNISGVAFGNALRDGVINGKVYSDTNNNGLIDPSEPGVAGAIVWVDRDNDCKIGLGENAIVTGADGRFGLLGIRPGTYNVRVSPPVGFDGVLPAGTGCGAFITVTVLPGQGTPDVNFLLTQVASLGPDFGDAPFPYPTTLAQNGARHIVQRDFGLGSLQDGEPDGQPSPLANADDFTGIDDEDGIQFDTIYYAPGSTRTIFVSVETGGRYPGKLQGFIDFNGDNDWDDAGERIVLDYQIGTTNLPIPITFTVPANAVVGETYARFRYGYEPGLGPTGPSIAGEVEDYRLFIVGPTPQATPDTFNLIDAGAPFTNLDVLSNDIPSSNGAVTIVSVTQPTGGPANSNGVVTISNGGLTIDYDPSGQLSQEVFTYTIEDSAGNQSTTTVTINLTIPPRAQDDAYLAVPPNANDYILGSANGLPGVLDNDIAGVGSLSFVGIVGINGALGTLEQVPGSPNLLQYTAPSSSFAGVEQFTYTVVNGDGLMDTATVTIQVVPGATNALVELRVEVLGLDEMPLTGPIGAGQEFFVRVYTDDLRSTPVLNNDGIDVRGVGAAYLDLIFNQTLVTPVANAANPLGFDITFGPAGNPNFTQALSGDIGTPGVVNEVGGFAGSSTPLGANPVEVFTIRFVVAATATNGTANFLTDPSDVSPIRDVVLFATANPVPPPNPPPPETVPANRLLLSQDSVQIVLGTPVNNLGGGGAQAEPFGAAGTGAYRNSANIYDVDHDGGISPIDALLIVNALNFRGPYSLLGDPNPSTSSTPTFLDVDGDDFLTPLDALMVITRLNAGGGGEAAEPAAAAVTAAVESTESPTSYTSVARVSIPAGETLSLSPIETNSSKSNLLSDETESAVLSAQFAASAQPVTPIAFVLGSDTDSDYGADGSSSDAADEELIESILTDLML